MSRTSRTREPPKAIANTKARFENIVWPEIQHWFGGGRLVAGEDVDTEVAELLDQEAGVDFYAVIQDEGVLTIASRCQKVSCFETTTVRYDTGTDYDTELQKRLRQLDRGMLSPMFTVHAYVNLTDSLDEDCVTGVLRNAAACRTADLFEHIDQTNQGSEPAEKGYLPDDGGWYVRTNSEDGNLFLAVPWQFLDEKYDLKVRYRGKTGLGSPSYPRPIGRPWWKNAIERGGES